VDEPESGALGIHSLESSAGVGVVASGGHSRPREGMLSTCPQHSLSRVKTGIVLLP